MFFAPPLLFIFLLLGFLFFFTSKCWANCWLAESELLREEGHRGTTHWGINTSSSLDLDLLFVFFDFSFLLLSWSFSNTPHLFFVYRWWSIETNLSLWELWWQSRTSQQTSTVFQLQIQILTDFFPLIVYLEVFFKSLNVFYCNFWHLYKDGRAEPLPPIVANRSEQWTIIMYISFNLEPSQNLDLY